MSARLRRRAELYGDALLGMTARQLVHRPRRLAPPWLLAVGTRPRDPRAWRPWAAGLAIDRAPQSGETAPPELTGEFAAVGRRRPVNETAAFWRPGEDGLLFAFHLHGFAELARYASADRCDEHDAFWAGIVDSWLRHHARPSAPAWHPYPMSGRIAAWCSALSREGWPEPLQQRMLRSLVQQATVLGRCVEHDIGGNHVLHNATALVFAGVCLGEPRLERRGLRLLQAQLDRQILGDGGHEERSTSYHHVVLGELADIDTLLERAGRARPPWLGGARSRMAAWERTLRGPDGHLALLNDAWEGAPEAVDGTRPAVAVLSDSGYVVLRDGGDQAILDVGALAPPHLPPHAHADALSFVLWADGRPLAVDPGSFAYSGSERRRFRGTASHNTVEVDGRDQCELWGDFRAAFMPRVELLRVDRLDDVTVVVAAHDGYRRLDDPVRHQRTFCWLAGDGLVVIDELRAVGAHRVRSRLHLAPGLSSADGMIGPLAMTALGAGPQPTLAAGSYAPHIGVTTPIEVVERSLDAQPGVPFGFGLLRPGAEARLRERELVVQRAGGAAFELTLPRC